jgi:4-alpha-glucanotransferase
MPQNLSEYLLNTASQGKWRRIGVNKRAGILVPLFSVYSKESIGVGDLYDLKLVIDWAHQTGNSIVQLLPMNELGSLFCPYDSLSSFALEPLYLSTRDESLPCNESINEKINNLSKLFSLDKTHLDYGLKQKKLEILWEIFLNWDHRDSLELKKFRKENAYWLQDFVLYKALKNYHHQLPWYEWEGRYKNRKPQALQDFESKHMKEITFQVWLQWRLYRQFKAAKIYAQSRGILLKGDLPILVSRDSADVWAHPEFFKLEFAAGAPPDMYCAKGQRWGMPTYNWERIILDDYRYLKEKLKFAENFYDLLRIDHVVGLFRIWSIPYNEPLENQGLNGFFDPKDESQWLEHGRNILNTLLNSTKMLLCAEDLGIIPKVCRDTLKELGIPGNDVQRWVKDYKIKHNFLKAQDYRALSVAMLSTHDTTNWPAWWEYEAGTVDESLFIRKCSDYRLINFERVKDKLFDLAHSKHARLRWQENIDSVEKLVSILDRRKQELSDFIDLYQNTYREKEKLWRHLGLKGPMQDKADKKIVRAALKISLESSAIFCINTIFDWLYLDDILKDDPYQYRINTPGTISEKNWSIVLPLPLEDLLRHRVTKEIRRLIESSGRI